jgi:hypothetical protein
MAEKKETRNEKKKEIYKNPSILGTHPHNNKDA